MHSKPSSKHSSMQTSEQGNNQASTQAKQSQESSKEPSGQASRNAQQAQPKLVAKTQILIKTKSGHVQISALKSGHVQISIVVKNVQFLRLLEIWTCPDLNLDMSRFKSGVQI